MRCARGGSVGALDGHENETAEAEAVLAVPLRGVGEDLEEIQGACAVGGCGPCGGGEVEVQACRRDEVVGYA